MKFSFFPLLALFFLHPAGNLAAAPPNAPTNLRAAAPFTNQFQIQFHWEDNSDDETGFEYELRETENGPVVFSNTTVPDYVLESIDGPIGLGDSFFFRVRAVNDDGESAWTDQVSITMPATPVAVETGNDTYVEQGDAFAFTPTTYGNPATGFSVDELPDGFSFDTNTGEISGTPTALGVYFPRVAATDGTSTASAFVRIEVIPRQVQLVAGEWFFFQVPDLGAGATMFSSSDLPASLSLDDNTGEVTGSFPAAGDYSVSFTATGPLESVDYFLDVSVTDLIVTAGLGESFLLDRFGILGGATFSSDNLPPGLTLDPATGVLSGLFGRAGVYEGSVTIAGATTVVSDFSIEVIETVPYVTGSVVGQALTHVPAKYGETPGNFSSGDLPPGLGIDPVSGDITGSPLEPGVFMPTITMESGGIPIDSRVTFRIIEAPQAPVAAVADQTIDVVSSTVHVDLEQGFPDPDVQSAVRIDTNLGNLDVLLYDRETPATVANFLSYVQAGDYEDVLFHRSTTLAGTGLEVIQAGWFKPDSGGGYVSVLTDPPVINEPGISNQRGTIAMAKQGGNPNSGTSQWYFNVSSSATALDPPSNNGGFTVFGRLSTPSLAVMDGIHSQPRGNYQTTLDGVTRTIRDWPTLQVPAGSEPAPADLVKIESVEEIPVMAYEVISVGDPSVVSASVTGGNLTLVRETLQAGTSIVEVKGTDLDGNEVTTVINVTVEAITEAGLSNDDDHDGMSIALEMALGGDIVKPDAESILPRPGSVMSGPENYQTLSFRMVESFLSFEYVVEQGTDLFGWTEIWSSDDGLMHDLVQNSDNDGNVTIRASEAFGDTTSQYLRLRVNTTLP